MTRLTLGILAYLVPTFALGFVWHLVLFKGTYEALAIYRSDMIIPLGVLSMLIQAAIFTWIYVSAGLREKESFGRRGHLRCDRRDAVVELHDARGRGQERDGLRP